MNSRLAPQNNYCSRTDKFLMRSPAGRKPFCKVCHDAGKPESDFNSHYVKSLPDKQGNTKVICPTLLSTECRYCYGLGHTAKFCPLLEARKKTESNYRREEIRNARVTQQPVQKPKVDLRGGRFNILLDDSDDEKSTPVVEDFPALGVPSQRVVTGSYASAAALANEKPAPIVAAKPLPSGFQVLHKGAAYEKTVPAKKMVVPSTSWAYDSDDDSDDDSDEEKSKPYVENSAW